jgi:hypothetical protein
MVGFEHGGAGPHRYGINAVKKVIGVNRNHAGVNDIHSLNHFAGIRDLVRDCG